MALSDDLLIYPKRLSAVRDAVAELVADLGATAAFLVDEDGTPFATVGHMEFRYPHPLTNLRDGEILLKALVGENDSEGSRYIVERAGRRALLALLLEAPLDRAARRHVRVRAKAIARLF